MVPVPGSLTCLQNKSRRWCPTNACLEASHDAAVAWKPVKPAVRATSMVPATLMGPRAAPCRSRRCRRCRPAASTPLAASSVARANEQTNKQTSKQTSKEEGASTLAPRRRLARGQPRRRRCPEACPDATGRQPGYQANKQKSKQADRQRREGDHVDAAGLPVSRPGSTQPVPGAWHACSMRHVDSAEERNGRGGATWVVPVQRPGYHFRRAPRSLSPVAGRWPRGIAIVIADADRETVLS